MTPKTPRVTADRLARALLRRGFVVVRQSGSHRIFRNDAGVRITLPMHAGTIVHPRIVRSVMEDSGISEDEI